MANTAFTASGNSQEGAKFWVVYTTITTTSILASYNMTSLTDVGPGITTLNFTIPFSSANYAVVATSSSSVDNTTATMMFTDNSSYSAPTASSCKVNTVRITIGSSDAVVCAAGYGDQ